MKCKKKRCIWINLLLVITMMAMLSPTTFAEVLNDGGVKVIRTAKEIPGQKNTWEMEIKLEGQNLLGNSKTDVVLVLDRSGSMKTNNRAGLVRDASKQLVADLVKQDNVRVGIVSFGGIMSHYRWYGDCTIEKGLTNDLNSLNYGINSALDNPTGGTPISLGIINAKNILEKSDATNKIMILLSDGEPTYDRNGGGDGTKVTDVIRKDTENAAAAAKAAGINIYTIAAGNDITSIGRSILQNCSSNNYYEAGDTAGALKSVMDSILTAIKDMVKDTYLLDQLTENFQIELDTKLGAQGSKLIPYSVLKDMQLDWSNIGANVVLTQGSIEKVETGEIKWNVGEIKQGIPAIIKYRVKMVGGDIGVEYEASKSAELSYTDINGKLIKIGVPNIKLKAAWAKLALNYLDNTGTAILDNTNKAYNDEVWYDLNGDETEININPQTTVDRTIKEVRATTDYNLKPGSSSQYVTLRRLNTINGYDFTGLKDEAGKLNRNLQVTVTKVQQPINFYYETYSGCNCSTVLGRVTAFVNERRANQDMFYKGQRTSLGNIRDDFREGIYAAIADGSEYEKQLAKYEIYMLLTHYPSTSDMAGKTPTQWIKTLDDILISGKTNASLEAANHFSNNIVKLIDFKEQNIGVDGYKDILLTLGIDGVDNKSMDEIETQLMHEHKKTGGVDLKPCNDEEDKLAACSTVNQPPTNTVNVGTGAYSQSIIGEITDGEAICAPTEGVHIGVADGIVAECTCRLEVNVITPLPAESPTAAGGSRNIIQPEALTNIAVQVEFKETSKDVSFSMDLSNLINEKMGAHEIMSFDLSKAAAYIKKTNTSSPVILLKDTDYTISPPVGNIVTITFKAPSSRADQCSVEAGDKYQFNLYVPTHMNGEIVYKNYLNQYSNISKPNTVSCKLVSRPRQRMRDHVFIDPPQFGDPSTVVSEITLIYYPIAVIN